MGNTATSRPMMEHTRADYTYETIDTHSPIIRAVHTLPSTSITQVALVCITLSFENDEDEDEWERGASERSVAYIMTNLRTLVRKTDKAFLLGTMLYFLLPGANIEGGQIVENRLWEALLWRIHHLTDSLSLLQPPCQMTIGHSACPVPCQSTDEFIEEAGTISQSFEIIAGQARQAGQAGRKTGRVEAESSSLPPPQDDIATLARQMGIPYLSLLPRKLSGRLQHLVNPKLARELHCYPVGRERNMLTVAMLDPADHSVLERLQQETGLHIFPVLTHPQELETALQQLL